MEGGAPKGRRLDGDGGVKKAKKIVSSTPFAKAPYPPLARSPFPDGEGKETRTPLFSIQRLSPMGKATIRGCSFSRIVKANTGYVEKKNNDGQSLPLEGKVASGASRIGL